MECHRAPQPPAALGRKKSLTLLLRLLRSRHVPVHIWSTSHKGRGGRTSTTDLWIPKVPRNSGDLTRRANRSSHWPSEHSWGRGHKGLLEAQLTNGSNLLSVTSQTPNRRKQSSTKAGTPMLPGTRSSENQSRTRTNRALCLKRSLRCSPTPSRRSLDVGSRSSRVVEMWLLEALTTTRLNRRGT